MLRGLLSLLHLAAAVLATFVLHDSRLAPPSGYVHEGAAPLDHNITFRIALAWGDAAGLEATLWNISHPASARYGQWLSTDELRTYVRPRIDSKTALSSFAESNGLQLSGTSESGDLFSFTTTVARANALFRADFQQFTHVPSGATLARTLAYSLPSDLVGHVQAIMPMTSFSLRNARQTLVPAASKAHGPEARDSASGKACQGGSNITPACLQALYGIPSKPIRMRKDNAVFVTGYIDEWPQQSDLAAYLATERPDISSKTAFNVVSLDNGTDPQGQGLAGAEGDLDIQTVTGLIGAPTTFLSVGGAGATTQDFLLNLLDTTSYLASLAHAPSVLSSSYGWNEEDISAADARKACAGLMALAARGVSILTSSGDGGVRGSHDQASQCGNNTFVPTFPSTCPHVTSVGGTTGVSPEVATNFSSGGFSNVFPRPVYQDLVVPAFLTSLPRNFAGVFNSRGRGFPDLAAQAENFPTVIGGSTFHVAGTSASAPVLAGVIALLNDKLLAAGRPTLGFLNPWLYLVAGPLGAFHDVTVGVNRGGVCAVNGSATAFTAQRGWDPLTGFGTPNWGKLLQAAWLHI